MTPSMPAGGQRLDDRVGIESRGVEHVRILVAVAPFVVGKGVDGEMKKGGGFELVPGQLAGGWQGPERRWLPGGKGPAGGG